MDEVRKIFDMSGLSNKQLARIFSTTSRSIWGWRNENSVSQRMSKDDKKMFNKFSELVLSLEADSPEQCKKMLLGWGEYSGEKAPYYQLLDKRSRHQVLQVPALTARQMLGGD